MKSLPSYVTLAVTLTHFLVLRFSPQVKLLAFLVLQRTPTYVNEVHGNSEVAPLTKLVIYVTEYVMGP